MICIFRLLLQKIQTQLALRAESKRIRVIREALKSYGQKQGISPNNNKGNNLWKI
jgi:hypothetical protein